MRAGSAYCVQGGCVMTWNGTGFVPAATSPNNGAQSYVNGGGGTVNLWRPGTSVFHSPDIYLDNIINAMSELGIQSPDLTPSPDIGTEGIPNELQSGSNYDPNQPGLANSVTAAPRSDDDNDNSIAKGPIVARTNAPDAGGNGETYTPGAWDDPNCAAGCYDSKLLNDIGIPPVNSDGPPAQPAPNPGQPPLGSVSGGDQQTNADNRFNPNAPEGENTVFPIVDPSQPRPPAPPSPLPDYNDSGRGVQLLEGNDPNDPKGQLDYQLKQQEATKQWLKNNPDYHYSTPK